MPDYYGYFLNSSRSTMGYETVEISHPNFTRTYWIVRNSRAGLTATLETGASQAFEYYPLKITAKESRANLDAALEIQLGDLGEILPLEMDAIIAASGFGTKPIVKYRTYRSDDLTAPMFGPITLQVGNFTFKREGAAFTAEAPSLNISETGEVYTIDRFPMLRGCL